MRRQVVDTSETYSKMCNCPEIQTGYDFSEGDYYAQNHPKFGYNAYVFCEEYSCMWNSLPVIWLPRQDQLQEMVKQNVQDERCITLELCMFNAFYLQNRGLDVSLEMKKWSSWEQLWLAFVMKEKYNKVWNGSEWVND